MEVYCLSNIKSGKFTVGRIIVELPDLQLFRDFQYAGIFDKAVMIQLIQVIKTVYYGQVETGTVMRADYRPEKTQDLPDILNLQLIKHYWGTTKNYTIQISDRPGIRDHIEEHLQSHEQTRKLYSKDKPLKQYTVGHTLSKGKFFLHLEGEKKLSLKQYEECLELLVTT